MKKIPLPLIFSVAFLVALCSIIYELMFSQLLTIIFGGTVIRYSITIGLFLFSLGIGSLLFGFIKIKPERLFVIIELLITLIGFIGVIAIIKGAAWYFEGRGFMVSKTGLLWFSYIPIILVGIISGIEIPLLAKLGESHKTKNIFGEVLGFDYFGSLVGTIIFALLLYPVYGVVVTAFFVSFINLVLALIFALTYSSDKVLKVLCLIMLVGYIFTFPQIGTIQEDMIKDFRGKRIFTPVNEQGLVLMQYEVKDFLSTRYQDIMITQINRTQNYTFGGPKDFICLHLDNDQQFCSFAVEGYHGGMVDVPMMYFDPKKDLDVLIIGGGDWIGVNYLTKFDNVKSITLVDIDKEFTEFAKTNQFISKYNDKAWLSEKLIFLNEDGFSYVLKTGEKYDLIILDLPGITHDKLSHLYSVEFFSNVKRILQNQGIVTTWMYQEQEASKHLQVLGQTLFESGFKYKLSYYGYAEKSIADVFILLSDEKKKRFNISTSYLDKTMAYYEKEGLIWEEVKPMGKKVHSIFWPNYDIIAGGV